MFLAKHDSFNLKEIAAKIINAQFYVFRDTRVTDDNCVIFQS